MDLPGSGDTPTYVGGLLLTLLTFSPSPLQGGYFRRLNQQLPLSGGGSEVFVVGTLGQGHE